MPAEWEPHAATWIGWPHNVTDWPGKFPPIPWVYGEIVRTLAPGEVVRILVNSALQQTQASRILKKVGVDLARVDFLRFPTNRGWTRDFGPIFVRRSADGGLAIARFHFNAWAKYKDWKQDDKIPERAAKQFKLPLIEGKIVLEGGSIDVNGRGTLITTEECLLDPKVQTRNPGLSRRIASACRGCIWKEGRASTLSTFRCPPPCISTAFGYPPATRTSTSPMPRCSCRHSMIPRIGLPSAFSPSSFPIGPWSGFTRWIWCGDSARSIA